MTHRIEEIKKEVANEFKIRDESCWRLSHVETQEYISEVCKRYAEECGEATLDKAYKNNNYSNTNIVLL